MMSDEHPTHVKDMPDASMELESFLDILNTYLLNGKDSKQALIIFNYFRQPDPEIDEETARQMYSDARSDSGDSASSGDSDDLHSGLLDNTLFDDTIFELFQTPHETILNLEQALLQHLRQAALTYLKSSAKILSLGKKCCESRKTAGRELSQSATRDLDRHFKECRDSIVERHESALELNKRLLDKELNCLREAHTFGKLVANFPQGAEFWEEWLDRMGDFERWANAIRDHLEACGSLLDRGVGTQQS
ncbi:hypothetical protein F5Y18DRAFT_195935 [Xylariaceae sp. FL1019]|nr:hypothetical protein F5Y18DRAFT_195935 [Xylariaceae sp. FL1019]